MEHREEWEHREDHRCYTGAVGITGGSKDTLDTGGSGNTLAIKDEWKYPGEQQETLEKGRVGHTGDYRTK